MPTERFFIIPNAFSGSTVQDLVAGKEIQAFKVGEFDHPLYGSINITPDLLNTFKENFDKNVYGQDIPINYEHFGMDSSKGLKAAGWLRGVRADSEAMYWTVAFTEEAAQEIIDGAWKYFSPEYYDVWTNPETNLLSTYVINGGALTNKPFFKGMMPLNFSEVLAESADWEHSEHMTFAEQFPAEYDRMQKLEVSERENKAKAFADRYATKRLVEGEGEEAKTTGYGFSSLTLENIEKMHLAFSEQKLTQAQIEDVLESLLNTGLVDYSERGTAVTDDTVGEATPQAFAEKIATIVTEDKIPYGDAVRVAGERYPELAKAYHETYTHRR
jgi:hypothetical protein